MFVVFIETLINILVGIPSKMTKFIFDKCCYRQSYFEFTMTKEKNCIEEEIFFKMVKKQFYKKKSKLTYSSNCHSIFKVFIEASPFSIDVDIENLILTLHQKKEKYFRGRNVLK